MKKNIQLLLIFLLLAFNSIFTQVGINTSGSSPDNSAMLDIQSTDKGMLIPRMTTAQRTAIASPATSLLVFDNTTASFWFYNGSIWKDLSTSVNDKIADTNNDTQIQVEESPNEDVIRFDLTGTERWTMTGPRLEPQNTGNSIFIGKNAGLNDDLTVNQNIFIGTNSGSSVTDQVQNTAIGNATLENLNSGFGNTVYGHETGKFIQTGSNNTIIGRLSGRGSANHTKNNNTFLGAQSGEISEASNNTYLGFQSGQTNVNGTGNLFIGTRSGQNELGSDKLYIDNSNTTSPLIYGEFDNDLLRVNGTLNINNAFSLPTVDGTANQVLQTDGAGNVTWQTNTVAIQNVITDADNNTKIQVEKSPNEDVIRFDVGSTEAMVVNNNGNVGIGTNAPSQPLEVIGLMRSTNSLGVNVSSTDIGVIGIDAVINHQPFNTGNIEFQINGSSKLTITEAGEVTIGANGDPLNYIKKITITKDIGFILAHRFRDVDFNVPGALPNSTVFVSLEKDLPRKISVGETRVETEGIVRVRFHNDAVTSRDPDNMDFYITVINN